MNKNKNISLSKYINVYLCVFIFQYMYDSYTH